MFVWFHAEKFCGFVMSDNARFKKALKSNVKAAYGEYEVSLSLVRSIPNPINSVF
jgi:hypothetical protein